MTNQSNDPQEKDKAVADEDKKKTSKNQENDAAEPVAPSAPAVADTPSPQDIDAMIDWASAMQEQNSATDESVSSASNATAAVFTPLSPAPTTHVSLNIEALKDVPVQITIELGRATMTVREVLQLGQGSVVELDSLAGEPLDILINGHLIAQGEVVVVGESYGVRLTDISSVSDRLSRYTKNN